MSRTLPILVALLTLATPALGQDASPEPEPPRTEWGLLLGGGDGKVYDPERTDTGLLIGGVRWGRDLGSEAGPVALLVEVLPLFRVSQDPPAWGGAFDLLLRYTFGRGDWRPALLGGIGMVVTSRRVPPGETHLNFTPQIGAGLRRMLDEDRALTLEYRFHHISNAGMSASNPGINTHMAVIVLSWSS